MKRLTVLLTICLLLAVPALADEGKQENPKTYRAVTKDYDVDSRNSVMVEETEIITKKVQWSLTEIDFYINLYEVKLEEILKGLKEMRELRKAIEQEVDKVKLKDQDEQRS